MYLIVICNVNSWHTESDGTARRYVQFRGSAAIAAEEAADTMLHEQNTEQVARDAAAAAATAAVTSTAEAATATVEAASIDAMLGSVGLPVQQRLVRRYGLLPLACVLHRVTSGRFILN